MSTMPEELLAKLINHLADKFKNKLVLKGGMLLRLLNSPRSTRDLDYCWAGTKKRNFFAAEIAEAIQQLEGITVHNIRCNSRGIFMEVHEAVSNSMAKIEISVEKNGERSSKPMATAPLVNRYGLPSRIIAAMSLDEALSHKIAATLERNLARDLYDLTQLEPLTSFDRATLEKRLSKLEIGRQKPRKIGFMEAAQILKEKADNLTEKKMRDELSAALPVEQLSGLDLLIRATAARLAKKIEEMAG